MKNKMLVLLTFMLIAMFLLASVVMFFSHLLYPLIANSKELASMYDNLKYNYKTELICHKNVSCTLKNYSVINKLTNQYTFKLPQMIFFNSEDVPIVVMKGYSRASYPVASNSTVKHYVLIEDYKYPVSADFQKGIKEYLNVSFFYDIPIKKLNNKIDVSIKTSNSTIMIYCAVFAGYALGVFGILYILLMIFNKSFFEKNLEKYFIAVLIIMLLSIFLFLFLGMLML